MDSWYYEIAYSVRVGTEVKKYYGIRRSLMHPRKAYHHFMGRCRIHHSGGVVEELMIIHLPETDPRTKAAAWEAEGWQFKYSRFRS